MIVVTGEDANWKRIKKETAKIETPVFVCHVVLSRKAAERIYHLKQCYAQPISPENLVARTIEAGLRAIETMMGSEEVEFDPLQN